MRDAAAIGQSWVNMAKAIEEILENKPAEEPKAPESEKVEKPEPEAEKPEVIEAERPTPEEAESEPAAPQPEAQARERDGFKGAYTAEKKKRQSVESEREELRAELDRREQRWRQDMQQLMQQFAPKQPEQPAPSFYEDPDGWQQRQTQTFEQRERTNNLYWSEQLARVKFGDEKFEAAGQEAQRIIQQNPRDPEIAAITASTNPGFELVKWYENRQKLSTLDNPEALIEQQLATASPEFKAKLLSMLGAQAPESKPTPAPSALPTNLAGARSARSQQRVFSGAKPLSEILGLRK